MKICSKCGTQLADNEAFCHACGAPADNGTPYQNVPPANNGMPYQNVPPANNGMPYQNVPPVNNGMPYQNQQMGYNPYGYPNAAQPKKKNGALIAILIILILAIAGVLIYVLGPGKDSSDGSGRSDSGGSSKNSSYEDPIDQLIKGFQEQDMNVLLKAFPEPLRDAMEENLLYYYGDEDDFWSYYSDYYGSDAKYSYEIEDKEHITDRDEISELEEYLEEYFDYGCSITDAYGLQVNIIIRGEYGTEEDSDDLVVGEINGQWYIIDM